MVNIRESPSAIPVADLRRFLKEQEAGGVYVLASAPPAWHTPGFS